MNELDVLQQISFDWTISETDCLVPDSGISDCHSCQPGEAVSVRKASVTAAFF